jgi:hypothetical protein
MFINKTIAKHFFNIDIFICEHHFILDILMFLHSYKLKSNYICVTLQLKYELRFTRLERKL